MFSTGLAVVLASQFRETAVLVTLIARGGGLTLAIAIEIRKALSRAPYTSGDSE